MRKSQEQAKLQMLILFKDLQLLEVIGEGSYGKVHRAVWNGEGGGIQVAVKVLFAQRLEERICKDMDKEVSSMSKLNHINVLKMFGYTPGKSRYSRASSGFCNLHTWPKFISSSSKHGIEEARRQAVTKHERMVIEAAYQVLSDDAEKIGFTYSGFALTSLPHKPQSELSGSGKAII